MPLHRPPPRRPQFGGGSGDGTSGVSLFNCPLPSTSFQGSSSVTPTSPLWLSSLPHPCLPPACVLTCTLDSSDPAHGLPRVGYAAVPMAPSSPYRVGPRGCYAPVPARQRPHQAPFSKLPCFLSSSSPSAPLAGALSCGEEASLGSGPCPPPLLGRCPGSKQPPRPPWAQSPQRALFFLRQEVSHHPPGSALPALPRGRWLRRAVSCQLWLPWAAFSPPSLLPPAACRVPSATVLCLLAPHSHPGELSLCL